MVHCTAITLQQLKYALPLELEAALLRSKIMLLSSSSKSSSGGSDEAEVRTVLQDLGGLVDNDRLDVVGCALRGLGVAAQYEPILRNPCEWGSDDPFKSTAAAAGDAPKDTNKRTPRRAKKERKPPVEEPAPPETEMPSSEESLEAPPPPPPGIQLPPRMHLGGDVGTFAEKPRDAATEAVAVAAAGGMLLRRTLQPMETSRQKRKTRTKDV